MAILDAAPELRNGTSHVPVEVTGEYTGPIFPQKFRPIRDFLGQHIVSAEQFDRETFGILFDRAQQIEALLEGDRIARRHHLEGYTLATLFYQTSTRTRLTMESAMLQLGGNVITESQNTSAQQKGEPIEHTLRVISGERGKQGMADVIGLRHPQTGLVIDDQIMRYANVPIINGGDGHREHIFQACKDVYFMAQAAGGIDNLRGTEMTFFGDQRYSRVSHSTLYALAHLGVSLNLVAPTPELKAPDELVDALLSEGHGVREFGSLEELDEAGGPGDYLYVTRLQLNLIPSEAIRNNPNNQYQVDIPYVDRHPGVRIASPMPIDGEINHSLDRHPRSIYFTQSDAGLPIAGALLSLVLKGNG